MVHVSVIQKISTLKLSHTILISERLPLRAPVILVLLITGRFQLIMGIAVRFLLQLPPLGCCMECLRVVTLVAMVGHLFLVMFGPVAGVTAGVDQFCGVLSYAFGCLRC